MSQQVKADKIFLFILTLIFSLTVTYFCQPLIHGNEQAINVIVTAFSILAGFLVAIIAIIGDPMLLPQGTWRAAEINRPRLINRLNKHKLLFISYLITLVLIFSSLLLNQKHAAFSKWLEHGYLFFATCAFVYSLKLPTTLMNIQKERIDACIEERRKRDGIPTPNQSSDDE